MGEFSIYQIIQRLEQCRWTDAEPLQHKTFTLRIFEWPCRRRRRKFDLGFHWDGNGWLGFPRPILHGMCTYGITCRGVLQTYADYDASAFRQHVARFSSPVYPGETVTMDLWKDGNVISFEAKVKSRGVTVIKNGKTVLG